MKSNEAKINVPRLIVVRARSLLLCLLLPCLGVYADPWEPWSGHIHQEYTGSWQWDESNVKTTTQGDTTKITCDATITGYTGNDTEITIPEKITMSTYVTGDDISIRLEYEATVKRIGNNAFNAYSYSRYKNLTSISIPNTVTNIGNSAFYYCSGLTSVTIPDSVTSIGENAFSGCSGLAGVTIPSGVKRIERGTFYSCSRLANVTLKEGLESIGQSAFYECGSLTTLVIPNSVKSIEATSSSYAGAFYSCSNLVDVTIGNGVTNIGYNAFNDCNRIRNVTVPQYVLDCGAGNSYRGIGQLFGSSRSSITNVSYSSVITNIGERAFFDCPGLLRATIPDTAKGIGDYAFYDCNGLTSVTIGNSVTSIGDYAFKDCTSLTSVTIPDSVTSIGINAFYGCSGLTSVTIGNGVTSIGNFAFYNCNGLTSVTIPSSVTSIGNGAFQSCTGLTSVTIPNSVMNIPDYIFRNCSGLTHVTIPDGVTSLGREAFSGCSSLTSVSIPESVTYFGASCFEGCPVYTLPLYRMVLGVGGSSGGGSSGGGTAVDPRYALAAAPADRTISTVTVDNDCAIDSFVLTDGKVYDTVLRIVNTADHAVTLTLPPGYSYERFKGTSPLTIPANSANMLTITRTADRVFFVTREELESIQ